jgi:hypothetical protein
MVIARVWSIAVPMLLCFGLFVAIFIRVNSWENDQSLFEFRLRSQQFADMMRATLEEQRGFLEQLSDAFVSRQHQIAELLARDRLMAIHPTERAGESRNLAPRPAGQPRTLPDRRTGPTVPTLLLE